MDYKIFSFKLDLNKENRLNIKPVQGESAVKLRPTLTQNSQAFNLTDADVRCLFRKPDMTYSFIDAVILDAAKGDIEIDLTTQVLLLSGSVVAAIEVTGAIGLAKTWLFTMDVQPGMPLADVLSIDEFPAVDQMLIDVADIKANFNAIVAGVTVDGEVILSRGGFTTLGDRLAALDTELTSLDEIVTDFTTDLNTIETQQITQDIRLTGQINNLVETTKPLVPDVKVSTYKPVTTLSPNAQEGQMNVKVSGQTLKNEVKNGGVDGSRGITGATYIGLKIDGGIIANGNYASLDEAVYNFVANDTYYVRVRFSVGTVRQRLYIRYADNTVDDNQGILTEANAFSGIIKTSKTAQGNFKLYTSVIEEKTKDSIVAINLTQTFGAGKEPTKEQMDEMVQHYFDGLSSVQAGAVKTVGKNLFSPDIYTSIGTNYTCYRPTETGIKTTSFPDTRAWSLVGLIKLKPTTTYVFSCNNPSSKLVSVRNELNLSLLESSVPNVSGVFTTSSSGLIGVKLDPGSTVAGIEISNIQLEEGTTATPYEPYQETVYCLPEVKLHSLPSGVRDIIEGNKLIKNVEEYVLKASDLNSLTNATTNQYINTALTVFSGIAPQKVSDIDGSMVIDGFGIEQGGTIVDKPVGSFRTSDTSLFLSIATVGTYTTLAQAQTALAGTRILYQLAEPIITELPPKTLKSNPKGSVIYLNSKKVISSYTTKAETTVPIKTITKLTKVLTDGTRIPVSVNLGIVIATDKLSFTHSSLVNGDNIEWEYDFDSSISTSPLIEYGYENSKGEFPARNQIVNGDFSKGLEGWSALSNPVIEVINSEIKLTSTLTYMRLVNNITLGLGKYYLAYKSYSSLPYTVNIYHNPTATVIVGTIHNKTIKTRDSIVYDSSVIGTSLHLNIYNIQVGQSVYFDDIVLINLTETFGAGNEPTKEQMDKIMELHGGWFDGTVNPLINTRQAFNLVAKKINNAWITPTLVNGYTEFSTTTPVRYMKDEFGFVHLKGKLKGGTIGAGAFTLPSGYQPTDTLFFPAIDGGNVACRLDVWPSGAVVQATGSNTRVSLDSITFKAEQ